MIQNLLKTLVPYLICFLMGVLLAWKGCGDGEVETITKVIEKPVPKIEYVDRWKTDTVRFVKTRIKYDTINTETASETIVIDTLYLVDTLNIVEAWLTEVAKYDTTVNDIRIRWQNYQNRTENLQIDQTKKVTRTKFAFGLHANGGMISDFKNSYKPLFGIGLQGTFNKTYVGLDYGYNSDHYIGIRVGRNLFVK
jgi:hypothetical protein